MIGGGGSGLFSKARWRHFWTAPKYLPQWAKLRNHKCRSFFGIWPLIPGPFFQVGEIFCLTQTKLSSIPSKIFSNSNFRTTNFRAFWSFSYKICLTTKKSGRRSLLLTVEICTMPCIIFPLWSTVYHFGGGEGGDPPSQAKTLWSKIHPSPLKNSTLCSDTLPLGLGSLVYCVMKWYDSSLLWRRIG